MHIYDKRYIKAIPQKEHYPLFEHSRPVVTFPTFRRRNWVYPHIGFDVHQEFNVVAAGTEDRNVQLFDLKSGRELHHRSLDVRQYASCIKIVDDPWHGPRLYVANGHRIDAWSLGSEDS